MPTEHRTASLNLLERIVAKARSAGADAADALALTAVSLSASSRFGTVEKITRAETDKLGLRVFVGRRQAVVASADLSAGTLDGLVERAVAMARAVPEDPFCGLPGPDELAVRRPASDLDLLDPVEPTPDELAERARTMEAAALAVPGVRNSRSVEAGWGRSAVAMVASNGFAGAYESSRHWLNAFMLASSDTAMERDYESDVRLHAADLRSPAEVGRAAGQRAASRLGGRKVASQRVPVLFDSRVASSLLDHLAAGIGGQAIVRGTSFLQNRLGEAVFPAAVRVVDDPFLPRGLRSRPFDGEGIAGGRRAIVDEGRLASWLLDLRSARQLGLPPTGHAARGPAGPPGPGASNLSMEPGSRTPADLIAETGRGLLVTELMGFGVNTVTGDYSRGASGFWIENGEITHPVNEITIAGNLMEMFRTLEAASDLTRRSGTDAPTVRVDMMTIAGR